MDNRRGFRHEEAQAAIPGPELFRSLSGNPSFIKII